MMSGDSCSCANCTRIQSVTKTANAEIHLSKSDSLHEYDRQGGKDPCVCNASNQFASARSGRRP